MTLRRKHLPSIATGTVGRPEAQSFVVEPVLAAADATTPPVLIGGPGGFGKTTLALQVCSDARLDDTFDVMLWAETGQDCTMGRIAAIAADLCEHLTGERPVVSTAEQAGFLLAEALGERRVLLVVDNVWSSADLAPFLLGGPQCVRLVTTRNLGVCRSRS